MPKKAYIVWCDKSTYGTSTGEEQAEWDANYNPLTSFRVYPNQIVPSSSHPVMQFKVHFSASKRVAYVTVSMGDIYKQERVLAALHKRHPQELIMSSLRAGDFRTIMFEHVRLWTENRYRVGQPVRNIGAGLDFVLCLQQDGENILSVLDKNE